MSDGYFKQCKVCRSSWGSRDEFIADEEIILLGYQANFVAVEQGMFLFNHSCGGTMAISVQAFSDLYGGPIYQENKAGTETCPGYCLHPNNFRPCPAKCECAFVRSVLEQLKSKRNTEMV